MFETGSSREISRKAAELDQLPGLTGNADGETVSLTVGDR